MEEKKKDTNVMAATAIQPINVESAIVTRSKAVDRRKKRNGTKKTTTSPVSSPAVEEKEFLLTENKQRFVLFPIKYPRIWEMYKKHEASFWTAEEIDLANDFKDWQKLNAN